MAAELIRDLGKIIYPNHKIVVTIEHPGRTNKIDFGLIDGVEAVIVDAVSTRQKGEEDKAKDLYLLAGRNAIRRFEAASTERMTAKDRRLRSECGFMAVFCFVEAGHMEKAKEFGERFAQDPLVREESAELARALIKPNPIS